MTKSDFTYAIEERDGLRIVSIEDLDLGRRSVTNDIENVVDEIASREGFQKDEAVWIYKDSDGVWDGWEPLSERFYPINVRSKVEAVELAVALAKE